MSAVVLLGAGASYGCGPCTPAPPPLGSQLFDELASLGGAASRLPDSIATAFRKDFEVGMHLVRTQHDALSAALLREMGGYFAQFAPLEGNLYFKLAESVMRSRRAITVVSLNYDVLFEFAGSKVGAKILYQPEASAKDGIRVLKIHGSCNFLPDVPMHLMQGIEVDNCTVHVEAPIRIASVDEVRKYCTMQQVFPPAMALYAPTKEVLYSPEFVRSHQAAWIKEAEQASSIYVIGVRLNLNDTHVWETIARSRASVLYVGGEQNTFRYWARENKLRNVSVAGATFAEGLRHITRRLSV